MLKMSAMSSRCQMRPMRCQVRLMRYQIRSMRCQIRLMRCQIRTMRSMATLPSKRFKSLHQSLHYCKANRNKHLD
ncbi:hypothetical protein EJ04DRAFT_107225 [Polyplosphaeria fusca]|uniref:Uncharacterized protein n=1 Tax=Polyplosphaeria fusca TaxID=682080 RepID=A0A9P4QP05_9PLEO|nr:hypothetical protein EJ04DRAFT_107225 [Polyplosphaeria fusca]